MLNDSKLCHNNYKEIFNTCCKYMTLDETYNKQGHCLRLKLKQVFKLKLLIQIYQTLDVNYIFGNITRIAFNTKSCE